MRRIEGMLKNARRTEDAAVATGRVIRCPLASPAVLPRSPRAPSAVTWHPGQLRRLSDSGRADSASWSSESAAASGCCQTSGGSSTGGWTSGKDGCASPPERRRPSWRPLAICCVRRSNRLLPCGRWHSRPAVPYPRGGLAVAAAGSSAVWVRTARLRIGRVPLWLPYLGGNAA